MSGWVVQHVQFDYSAIYNDSDNSKYTSPNPPTPSYWEAWRVDLGVASAGDIFQTRAFPESTHGTALIAGKVCFFEDSAFNSSNSPGGWSTSEVSQANFLNATTDKPSWWTGLGYDHKLTVTWE